MITTTTVTIGERSITCKELVVGEIDTAISVLQTGSPMQRIYNLMGFDLPPNFVATSAGLTVDEQADLTTAELCSVVAAVELVNADFLDRIRDRDEQKAPGAADGPGAQETTSAA